MAGIIKTNSESPVIISHHNYDRYVKFIAYFTNQQIDGYSERHHILPRSFGGNNSKENLIRLTARQHFIAHKLLWNAYKGSKMGRAYYYMCNLKSKNKSSKSYEEAKLIVAEATKLLGLRSRGKKLTAAHKLAISKGHKNNPELMARITALGNSQKSKVISKETREKMSRARKGVSQPKGHGAAVSAGKRGKSNSKEHNENISSSLKGRVAYLMTDEIREKISVGMTGKVVSEETKEKLRKAALLQWAKIREVKQIEKGGNK